MTGTPTANGITSCFMSKDELPDVEETADAEDSALDEVASTDGMTQEVDVEAGTTENDDGVSIDVVVDVD